MVDYQCLICIKRANESTHENFCLIDHCLATRAKETSMAMQLMARLTALAVLSGAAAVAPCAYAQSRGELLYSTHCISCHTSEMHWRDKKVAVDWTSLRFQVRRWQGNAGLSWSEADIRDVTRYLNESIYRYTETSDSSAPNAAATPKNRLQLPSLLSQSHAS